MRVLLDECLPRRLKHEVAGHEVSTVPEMGWAGTKNGALLLLAAPSFDAFVTIDQGVQFQQNLAVLTRGTRLGVIVLSAPSNRVQARLPLLPHLHHALSSLQPGQMVRVSAAGTVRL